MNKRNLIVFIAAVCGSGFSECGASPHDAGDAAWAHDTIPFVLGRKPRGVAELNAVSTLVAQHGRTAVTDAFFQEPEFVDYWSTVLVDILGVRKSGYLQQSSSCYNNGAIDPNDVVNLGRLADHLRTAPTSAAFEIGGVPVDWTMADAIRAAVVDDDLTVAYLAYLPALVSEHRELDFNQAQSIADQFREYYLDRNMGCTSCHSSHLSRVDTPYEAWAGQPSWDRHYTSPWNLETSVLGGQSVAVWLYPAPQPAQSNYSAGSTHFTNTCAGCHGANGDTLKDGMLRLKDRVPMMSDDEIFGAFGRNGMAGVVAPTGTTKTQLVSYLRQRFGDLDDLKRFFQEGSVVVGGANRPWHMSQTCTEEIVSHQVPNAEPSVNFAGSVLRSASVLDVSDALRFGLDALAAEMTANPGNSSAAAYDLPTLAGQPAFAMMVARRVANALTKETFGARLVLDHGFARNADQSLALDWLTTLMLVTTDRTRISLRAGLRQLVSMRHYNQLAPSAISDPPYSISMFFNPWAGDSTGVVNQTTGVNSNGNGDDVHRYSATNLLWSTRDSLGWGEPTYFPLAAGSGPLAKEYPRRDYVEQIGGRISDDIRGGDSWDLSSLLYWESVAGACGLTGPSGGQCVPSRSGDCTLQDWIDDVIAAAPTIMPAPTLRELFVLTRDRLLADPTIPLDEEAQINALLPPSTTLASVWPASAASRAAWETSLRQYCGALMTSPQYTMSGLVTVTAASPGPRFTVCQPGEVCSEHELCTLHAAYIGAASTCP